MAVELIAYAAPVAGGVALVAPPSALRTLASAGRVLSLRPQAVRLAVIAPANTEIDDAARPFFRLAAARAALPRDVRAPGVTGRWHAALVAFGWLLLLAAGGSAGAALAGLWLVAGYPAFRRAALRRQAQAHTQAAVGLAHALTGPALETREHAGLATLSRLVADGDGWLSQRYRHAASACEALGLAPLSDFYEALARGAQPAMPWGAVLREHADGAV